MIGRWWLAWFSVKIDVFIGWIINYLNENCNFMQFAANYWNSKLQYRLLQEVSQLICQWYPPVKYQLQIQPQNNKISDITVKANSLFWWMSSESECIEHFSFFFLSNCTIIKDYYSKNRRKQLWMCQRIVNETDFSIFLNLKLLNWT